ncbi:MAG: S-layer homology domain-containing protein [Ruminiclostridium sp.]|nr:S-layer homology domain-containing protein [Ruminiclostridium sp.]
MKKRILSLLLALSLMMGLGISASAYTLPFRDQAAITHKMAVSECVELGILNGFPEGDFRPNNLITRAQFCKIMAVTVNGGSSPNGAGLSNPFYDVKNSEWYRDHVAYCHSIGLVDGIGANLFRPEGNVTAMQAAKMMLVAMGYEAAHFGFVGPHWAQNVEFYAEMEGLFDLLGGMDRNAPLTRDNAAQMLYNAMDADPHLYGSQLDENVYSASVSLTQKTYYYRVPGQNYSIPLTYDYLTVEGNSPAAQAINRTIQQDYADFCRGVGRHELMGTWMEIAEKYDDPDDLGSWFLPATVNAMVTHNQDGILSICFQAHYIYDHYVNYGMTFDLKTGQLMTASQCSGYSDSQLLSIYKNWLQTTDEVYELYHSAMVWEGMTMNDLGFVIDLYELVLFSPELQYPDGTRVNFEIWTGIRP